MDSKKNKGLSKGILIIASAIIWGAVIVGTAYALKGTDCYDKIQNYLVAGVITHTFLFVGAVLPFKKKTEK